MSPLTGCCRCWPLTSGVEATTPSWFRRGLTRARILLHARLIRCVAAGCLVLAGCLASSETAIASGWSAQLAPAPVGSSFVSLSRVSCTARNACTAVGGFVPAGEPPSSPPVALMERWNGSRWSIQQIPRLPSGQLYQLNSVSCTSRRACVAVGGDFENSFPLPVAERWNGARWSIQSLPRRVGPLGYVSCTSRSACVAVGYGFSARLTGTRWSIQHIASQRSLNADLVGLEDVSCSSAIICVAVGRSVNGNFASRWNGLSWHAQHVPTLDGEGDDLNGVSCTSATACLAVGEAGCENCNTVTSAERWDGTRWSSLKSRNPNASGGNDYLNDVSCVSATACIAVGGGTPRTGYLLAERWNGTRWAVQPTPNAMKATRAPRCGFTCAGTLSGVSCTSARSCIAVGSVSYTGLATKRSAMAAIVARYS